MTKKKSLTEFSVPLSKFSVPPCRAGNLIELNDFFPISVKLTIQKAIPWLSTVIISWLLILAISINPNFISVNNRLILKFGLLLLLLGIISYWEIYRRNLKYRIEGFRLVKEFGVFTRNYDSRAIVPVNVVTVKQSVLDRTFNLYELRMFAGPTKGSPYISIPGLSYEQAMRLENYLGDQMSRMTSPSDDVAID
jgi:membrane protein YdbS with pleckstrin-like domain